jgi:hypothetical protein
MSSFWASAARSPTEANVDSPVKKWPYILLISEKCLAALAHGRIRSGVQFATQ